LFWEEAMSVQSEDPGPDPDLPQPPIDPAKTDAHVPEWAEDMEHTLRRLMREKQKKRDETPGLYR
jgi:hypothetical protein